MDHTVVEQSAVKYSQTGTIYSYIAYLNNLNVSKCTHHLHFIKNFSDFYVKFGSDLVGVTSNGFGFEYTALLSFAFCLCHTCLSKNSRVSFSMCPSYKLVVRLIRPILERPKSVSLMWPIEVIRRLRTETAKLSSTYTSFF